MNDEYLPSEKESVFELKRKEDPKTLLAIRTRELVCDDPNISDGAARMFVRLLDLALNPFNHGGTPGRVPISQLALGNMIKCDERSVRRRSSELIEANYIWTSLLPRQNTKPMTVYFITAFVPKRQAREELPGDGLWGNGKRRHDHGFARTGREATGQMRRVGNGLVDRFGNQIFLNYLENAAASGQKGPFRADNSDRSDRTLASSGRGQICPVTEDAGVLSQRTVASSHSGQNCPVTEDASVRLIESQIEKESPLRVGGKSPLPDLGFEASVKSLYSDKRVQMKRDLLEKLAKAETAEQKQFYRERIAIVEKVIYGGEPPKAEPKPKRPASAPVKAPELTTEQLLEGARYLVSVGKSDSLTQAQRKALAAAREAVGK